jgi:hypothetical protein
VLSGIVDLSAYSTSEEIQSDLATIQNDLSTKASKSDIPSLDGLVKETDLSTVALSNSYLDLDDKPCYHIGLNQTINGTPNTDGYVSYYNSYFLKKGGDYDINKTVQDYIDAFVHCQYGKTFNYTTMTDSSLWTINNNGIAVYTLVNTNLPIIFIVPKDNLTYSFLGYKGMTFNKGIYYVIDRFNTVEANRDYVVNVTFKEKYIPLNINYLPQEIIDLQTTKVDVDPNARLMTNAEGDKLTGIEDGANNYTLPAATSTTLGGVKVGENLSISEDGTISATSLDWDNVDGKPELYTKDEVYNKTEVNAIQTTLNNTIVTSKTELNNTINSTKTALETSIATKVDKVTGSRLMTETEGTKLAGIAENANNYTLPAATSTSLGGVKVGANLSVSDDGTLSATSLAWDNVQNKPDTFTPSTHNHDALYYTESEIDTKVNTLQTNINSVSTNLQTAKSSLESSISSTKSELQELIETKQSASNLVTYIDENSTDEQYPSAKLLYNIVGDCSNLLNEISKLIGE